MKSSVLVLFVIFSIFPANSANLEALRHCCGLGTDHANSGLECATFPTPIAGIYQIEENECMSSAQSCCRKQNNELQCTKGIDDGRTGNCEDENGVRKECCDACRLGIEAGASGGSCTATFSTYNDAFTTCCTELAGLTRKSATKRKRSEDQPPVENVCDIGDVCAQICTPTVDSYRCDCNKGFMLMADGISCKAMGNAKKTTGCAVNNPCEQQCIDTGLAIKCACDDGYRLRSDKKTCEDIDECALNVSECLKTEVCVNDIGGYYCEDPNFPDSDLESDANIPKTCPDGYKLDFDTLLCNDIDECQFSIICPRPKVCINTIGSFKCEGDDQPQCPPGFFYKSAIDDCADIDECVTGDNDCNRESQTCLNTKGNYTCIDKVSKKTCPPGFKKNVETNNCDDINECEESEHLCAENEECVNEPGGHTCEPRTTSKNSPHPYPVKPPQQPETTPKPVEKSSTTTSTTTPVAITCSKGYQVVKNECKDINECRDEDTCDSTQDCYNIPGSYICHCKNGYTKDYQTSACIDLNECQLGTHDCQGGQRCDNTVGSYLCARITGCGTGYTLNYANGLCEDDDECALQTHNCHSLGPNFKCRNKLGSYRCESVNPKPRPTPRTVDPSARPPPNRPVVKPPPALNQSTPFESGNPKPPPVPFPSFDPRSYETTTPQSGFEPRTQFGGMNQSRPLETGNRRIMPDPFLSFDPRPYETTSQQSAFVPRRHFGGYQPVYPGIMPNPTLPPRQYETTGYIEPMKQFDGHSPTSLDPRRSETTSFKPRRPYFDGNQLIPLLTQEPRLYQTTTQQSRRQIGNHPSYSQPNSVQISNPSYKTTTQSPQGDCEDINECLTNPCAAGQKCLNFNGTFQCVSGLQCTVGYEPDAAGAVCVDIDECERGTHKCYGQQICRNRRGFYTCECPPGLRADPASRRCVDVNECLYRAACGGNARCTNTFGSYRCECPPGLQQIGNTCVDVDECRADGALCEQTCVNTWGGYRCACRQGFALNRDNRTCTDADECEEFKLQRLCVGICENVPGSYQCRCPDGYNLGADKRTCRDVDECRQAPCKGRNDVCINTQGSYKCYPNTCPNNYFRDPQHLGRCVKPTNLCDVRDVKCIETPDQYSYHYITIVSNYPVSANGSIFFQTKTPNRPDTINSKFSMKIVNVNCPYGVEKANEHYFRMVKPTPYQMELYWVKPIQGPQEIEIRIDVRIYQGHSLIKTSVAHIFLLVSEYQF